MLSGKRTLMASPLPSWLALVIAAAVFAVMFSLGLMLGLYIPPYLDGWYRQAAAMLGH